MLVYGDHDECAKTLQSASAIRDQLQRMPSMEPGLDRHATLVSALIEAGRLHQGVADATFRNLDEQDQITEAIGAFVHALARSVLRSWDSGGAEVGDLPSLPDLAEAPPQVELRSPEGFAYYAVYPEAFADAARRLALAGPPKVIGLRSIGTTLAAIVAAALEAPPPVTLRPFGEPSARQVALSPALESKLLDGPAHYVIVDEGPGLSGSSFNAVVDWLRRRGVPLDRIAVLPSHGGAPGASVSDAHRNQWAQLQRAPADLGPRLNELLHGWVEELVGPLDGPLIDISGGKWRRWAFARENDWPAADPTLERLKYLAFASGETWLVKFAGLGREGERKLDMARRLHAAKLAPEPRGLVHGFLIERWHGNAKRLQRHERPLDELAHAIATRARALDDLGGEGASIAELYAMVQQNLAEAGISTTIAQWADQLGGLDQAVRRFPTDNRMAPHEWLRLPSGELLKTDAVDHHHAHDLVGCQDVAWDVTGAIVEFDMSPVEAMQLIQRLETCGQPVQRDLLDFCLIAYRSFRIGQLQFALDRASDAAEADRTRAEINRVRRQLETCDHPVSSTGKPVRILA